MTRTDIGATQSCSGSMLFWSGYDMNTTTRLAPPAGSNCTVSTVPNCTYSGGGTNLPWGSRLVRDSAGVFRYRINAEYTFTYSGAGCYEGTRTFTGVLSPRVDDSSPLGTGTKILSDGATGVLSNPTIGNASVALNFAFRPLGFKPQVSP